ncbi:MAG: molybdopterin cofactor-binding domain-containing protein [Limisphaerales bacterium]
MLEGEFSLGGQEHFYLEMQAACAEQGEDGSMFVMSSTQHPSEVQHIVAHLLHVPVNQVVVQSPRMGGGFGGKETQAATFAALAALAAAKTNRPVRVRVNRDLDMMITGKRHPFLAKFKVGYNSDGDLLAAKIELISNGGWSLDLSMPVTDRAVFHLDNSYFIPAVEFSGQVAKTNLASNTAFRGFGGPQGMLVIEEIIDRIARRLGKSPEEIRERNLYRGSGETNTTHYGQEIEDNRIQRVWRELKESSAFEKRRVEIAKWNSENPHLKRGLAMTPVKFGISFTLTHLNQAGALVLIYQDGTVQVNHGATEMGQGVHHEHGDDRGEGIGRLAG